MTQVAPGVIGVHGEKGILSISCNPSNGRLSIHYAQGDDDEGDIYEEVELQPIDIDVLCGMLAHYIHCKGCIATRATEDALAKAMNPDQPIG